MSKFKALAVSAALLALGAPQAFAGPTYTLTVEDAGTSASQTYSNSAANGISAGNQTIGSFVLTNISATSTDALDDVSFGANKITYTGGASTDTIELLLTVSGLTALPPSVLDIATTASSNFTGGNIQGWSETTWYDPANGVGTAGEVHQLTNYASGLTHNGFFQTEDGSGPLNSGLFSYTVLFTITLTGTEFAGNPGASTELSVPEPVSAALLIVGMTAVGVASRRRRRVV